MGVGGTRVRLVQRQALKETTYFILTDRPLGVANTSNLLCQVPLLFRYMGRLVTNH